MGKLQARASIILLLALNLQQGDAFGTSLKVTQPRSATLFPSTSRNVVGESDFSRESDGIAGPQTPECISDYGEAILRAVDSSISKKESYTKRLLWACMLLVVAQLSQNIPTFSNALRSAPKNAATATLTASFIRDSRTDRQISGKQLLAITLLGWQLIPQAIKLITVLPSVLSQYFSWYIGRLEALPLVTKACSAAVVGFLGDTAAQQFEERTRIKREGPTAAPIKYDVRRGLSIIADGLLLTGPFLHFVYDFLESLIPISGSALPPSLAALSQVLLDDIFVDSIFVASTILFTGIIEGYGKQTISQFKKDFIPTLKAGWATSLILMPLEFTCFRFLPVSFRVLGMNFVDIVWDGVLSYQVHKSRLRMAREAAESAELAKQGFNSEEIAAKWC